MSYQFSTRNTATFAVPATGAYETSKTLQLSGISAKETDAQVICNGIASLFAIGGLTADFVNGLRTVKENVNDVQP